MNYQSVSSISRGFIFPNLISRDINHFIMAKGTMLLSLKTQIFIILITMLVIFITPKVFAGNPLYMGKDGKPLIWDTSQTIKYKVDAKGLGTLSFDESVKLIQESLAIWEAVSDTGIKFEYIGPTAEAISLENWKQIAANHVYAAGYNGIPTGTTKAQINSYFIFGFDNTGEIIEAKGNGKASGVQSLTGIKGTFEDPKYITSGHIFLNGLYFNGNDSDITDLELIDLMAITVHEIGHALGLDHNLFHYEMYKKILQGTHSRSYSRYLPTMFPRFIKTTGQHLVSLHPDDIATLKWMYGDSEPYTISGNVYDANGIPQNTLVVTARDTSSSLCYSYAQATSIMCSDMNTESSGKGSNYYNGKHCMDEDSMGYYQIPVLDSGKYSIDIQEIPDFFKTAIAKFDSNIHEIPGGAEFYNFNDDLNEDALILNEVIIHDDDQDGIDITLATEQNSPKKKERIEFTYFEQKNGINLLAEEIDCPIDPYFDIESLVYNAAPIEASEIASSINAATDTIGITSAGCSLNTTNSKKHLSKLTSSPNKTTIIIISLISLFIAIIIRSKVDLPQS
ncbi:hypothetical protein BVY03_03605 [bacterium K02(2017)]|nr:hypothetical protein BVY03_03605 [bacterium K02(2017)]